MNDPTATLDRAATQDEADIRALIAAWSKALEARDVDGLTAAYAPDVVIFDVKDTFRIDGVPAYRQLWQQCLPFFPKRFRSEHRKLEITVSGDLAFAHGLHHIVPADDPDHPAGTFWIRFTTCYHRRDGHRQVVHEHASIPFDCATGQITAITEDDSDPGNP